MTKAATVTSESTIVALAAALGAADTPQLSAAEKRLIPTRQVHKDGTVAQIRERIRRGHDPLGEMLCSARSPRDRRLSGTTYTPAALVAAMIDLAADGGTPSRVIDPATGSARLLIAAGQEFPHARLLGFEIDPVAALIARANISVHGLAKRATVLVGDFCSASIPGTAGNTLYLANPPYTRHHDISHQAKKWFVRTASRAGVPASLLAGLHAYFFLATAMKAKPNDYGVFLTSGSWLDASYGASIKTLFLDGLGADAVVLIDPRTQVFADARTTAVIARFHKGAGVRSIHFSRLVTTGGITRRSTGRWLSRKTLCNRLHWNNIVGPRRRRPSADFVELGELCRVHRGQATGLNRIWIAGAHTATLPPEVLFPTITRANEIVEAHGVLRRSHLLRCVVDLPSDLDAFASEHRRAVDEFLSLARQHGAQLTYLARHRSPWWRIGLRAPAPIVVTYMGRRPPAFARNLAGARLLNIAHGIYPREPLSSNVLDKLAECLAKAASSASGRTYAGGLLKYEPSDIMRMWVARPEALA